MRYLYLLLLPLVSFGNTLPSVIEKVQHNDIMKSMHYITKAQKKALSSIKSAYLPKLSANALYSYLSEDQRSFIDPETTASLEASFVLFDGFKRYHSLKAQNNQVKVSKEQALHQRETLTFNTIKLYFSLLSLQANINAKEQKRKQLIEEVLRLEKFFQAGSISEDKLEQIKAASAMTEYELALLHQNYHDITLTLSTLADVIIDSPVIAHLKSPNFTQKGTTHELKAVAKAITALKHQAQVKTADYWPTIILKDTFSTTAYYDVASALPIEFPASTNKIQLVAQMTLFDFFGKSHEKESLLLQKKAKEADLSFKKRDLTMKQKLAKIQIETSIKKINAARQSLKSSEKSFS
ncbi:MAG: TolC family protein, partial [Thiovulaceae bacterium]|nr:TolC family protein [Sulfurimonadaceae bacterium]